MSYIQLDKTIKLNVFTEEDDEGELVVRIDSIVVPKSKRFGGVGRLEVENIIKWSISIGAKYIILESERPAIPFWKKMGFDINDQNSSVSTGILDLDKMNKLHEEIRRLRSIIGLNENDIPYAEEIPDGNPVDEANVSIKNVIDQGNGYLEKMGSFVINSLTLSIVSANIGKYKGMVNESNMYAEKIRGLHTNYFDILESFESGFDPFKLPSNIKLLDKYVGEIDELYNKIQEISEILDEMVTRADRFKRMYPDLLTLGKHNITTDISRI